MYFLQFFIKYKEIFLLLLLTFIFFHKIILHPFQMLYPAFDVSIYAFWKTFFVESIVQNKSLPLWNPYLFGGNSFIGNSQSAMFYPINYLYLLSDVKLIFGWIFMLDIFLVGVGTYLFARTIHLDKFSAILSATIMMFSGTLLVRLIPGHILIIDGIVWFPFLFFLYEKCLQAKKMIYGIIAALPLACMLISGNTQIAAYTLLSLTFYFILRYLIERRAIKNKLAFKYFLFAPLLSIGIAVLLSAVQLLPSSELAKLSIRGNGLDYPFSADFSLHPYQTLAFILPHFFGEPASATFWGKGNFWETSGYLGALPLILVTVALFFKRNKYIFIFSLLGLFAYLFSLGKYGPFFSFFYHYVPFFDNFRAPARFLFIYIFSIAILAGFGAQYLTQKKLPAKPYKKFLQFFFTGILLVALLLSYLFTQTDIAWYEKIILRNSYAAGINHEILYNLFMKDLGFLFLMLAAIVITFFLKIINKIPHNFFKASLFVIIICELWFFGIPLYNTKNPTEVFTTPKEIQFIKKDPSLFRVLDLTTEIRYLTPTHLQVLTGFDPLILASYRDFLWLAGPHYVAQYEPFIQLYDITNINILKLLNTKYIVSYKPLKNTHVTKVYQNENFVYQINETFPRAMIVPNAKVLADKNHLIKELQKRDFNPKEFVLLDKNPGVALLNKPNSSHVSIKNYHPDKIELSAELKNPGFLLVSETYYPGWKAYDNGKEIEIYRSNYIFRSVFLDKGKHTVKFSYQPQTFTIGLLLSSLTLCLYILYMIYYIMHKK